MWFRKDNKTPPIDKSKIKRKKVMVIKSSRNQNKKNGIEDNKADSDTELKNDSVIDYFDDDQEDVVEYDDQQLVGEENDETDDVSTTYKHKDKIPPPDNEAATSVLTDTECDSGKKKHKIGHRKTMSVSNTIELVKSMGDEWIEAAKKEFEEHSRKREMAKNKDKDSKHESSQLESRKIDEETSLLPTKDLEEAQALDETATPNDNSSKKSHKKKIHKQSSKDNPKNRKISAASQMMNAQKMNVKKIAKASSVSALSFIRKKKSPVPTTVGILNRDSIDYVIFSTSIFLESEKTHTNMVQDPSVLKTKSKQKISTNDDSSTDEYEDIFFDAHSNVNDLKTHTIVAATGVKTTKPSKARRNSIKRNGAKRKSRRKCSVEDTPPPLPPRPPLHSIPPPKHSHWLFGSSFRGDFRKDDDASQDTTSHTTDSSHIGSEHSTDRENHSQWRSGIGARPVTRAESYRDRADRVRRTKRKTSDPNQLTSNNKDYPHDADAVGSAGIAAPSGGSSNSSLSSKSNDSNHAHHGEHRIGGSQSEWSDEDENSAPWSSKASPDLIASLSSRARKRQDLIHELIQSEASHVRWLRVLRRVYLVPLQRNSLVPTSELQSLIPNLPDVLSRHKKLSTELRTLASQGPTVQHAQLAHHLLNMLGENKYAVALSKFCREQGLALEALKERRRRNKELNVFLTKSEQDPICSRLRLQDLLACVWQRLTKYQLLLEGIMKTAEEEEVEDDFSKTSYALDLVKEVLNSVNSAIKTAENEHRLKSIQQKLEIRGIGGGSVTEADPTGELRRLDLSGHDLVMEGNLSIKQDSNKRVNILALLLREFLVLLHTDGDRYILKPIPQSTHQPLSPIVYWSTVIFRPNAAVKNGFFLVNINGIQMYELAAVSNAEYITWTRHLYEAATALEPQIPMNTQPVSSNPDNNTSSEISPNDDTIEENPQPAAPVQNDENVTLTSGAVESIVGEENRKSRLGIDEELVLSSPTEVAITQPPPAHTAVVQLTPEERLRQAEEKVALALKEAADAAREVWGSKPFINTALNSLGGGNIKETASNGDEIDKPEMPISDLLLSAQSHVNTLTDVLLRALRISPVNCSMTKCSNQMGHGLCDGCFANISKYSKTSTEEPPADQPAKLKNGKSEATETPNETSAPTATTTPNNTSNILDIDDSNKGSEDSFVILEQVGESSTDNDSEVIQFSGSNLREILSILMQRIPAEQNEKEILRARLQQADQRLHRLHHLHKDCCLPEEKVKVQTEDKASQVTDLDA